MRLLTVSKLLVLGGAAACAYKFRDAFGRGGRAVGEVDLQPDPRDPVQGIDEAAELQVVDLDVDALDRADAEAAQDLAVLASDLDDRARELDTPSETDLDAVNESTADTGEIYGVHQPPALDTLIPEDRVAMTEGENWIEALEASATEFGPAPEIDVDVTDDQDVPPHPSDARDTPVADHGSGGPAGV